MDKKVAKYFIRFFFFFLRHWSRRGYQTDVLSTNSDRTRGNVLSIDEVGFGYLQGVAGGGLSMDEAKIRAQS